MTRQRVLMTAILAAIVVATAARQALSESGQQAAELTEGLERYHHDEDHHHTKPKYAYQYSVHDKHTGDVKDVWEHRDGDVTKGGYTLLEPDGHTRVVEYIVTKKGGFQATVKRLPPHHHH
ncbi:cuticle protein 19-like [Frankliniella occidentalis]|uniref:Cuticle protein 19-like n=1 Tax=Frankliniella occidentalis TaxID=133901 RepID=A0A6J1S8L4_FRAOC|nr:cuticle protein 19-like [Frankliniella occidentalis]